MHSCEFPKDILPTIFYLCYNNDFKSIVKFSELNKLTNEIASKHLQEIKKIYKNLYFLKLDFTFINKPNNLSQLIAKNNCNNGIGIKFNGRTIEFNPIKLKNLVYTIVDPMSGTIRKCTDFDTAENYDYDFTIKVIFPKETDYSSHCTFPIGLELNTSKAHLLVDRIKNVSYAIELANVNYQIKPKEEEKVEQKNIIYSIWNTLFGNK